MREKRNMQVRIVCNGVSLRKQEMCGHVNAPSIPAMVTSTEIPANARGVMPSEVLAKRIETPETVAIASDRRNHDARKIRISGRAGVRRIVLYSDAQECLI